MTATGRGAGGDNAKPSRVDAILEAAVSMIAAEGLRGLTHRAVDARAGLPSSSTSYYFRTRQALVHGVADHIARRELAAIDEVRPSSDVADAPPLRQAADMLAGMLARWLGPDRERTRVRLEIWLASIDRPESRGSLDSVRERFIDRGRMLLDAIGAPATRENAALVATFIEGLTYDGIVHGLPGPPDRARLRHIIETFLQVVVANSQPS